MTSLAAGPGQLLRNHAIAFSHHLPHSSGGGAQLLSRRCAHNPSRPTIKSLDHARPPRRAVPSSTRGLSSSAGSGGPSGSGKRPRFSQRLGEALRNSKIQWYQIPVGLGIGFLGLVQFYKVSARERERAREEETTGMDGETRPAKRRQRIRPDGPWCV
jgi:phosphatidylserine decarboxylase